MVFDAREVRSVAVFDVEVSLAAQRKCRGASEVFVDMGDLLRDV